MSTRATDFEQADAVPSSGQQAADLPPWGETRFVGKATPRVDAYDRVSGTAVYVRDMALPGMLHGAIVRCPHANARVRKVDVSKAGKMPGVHAIITGDTAAARIPWYFTDKGPASWIFPEHCKYEGEEVAGIAADTPEQAADAARAVVVDYEVLPFVVNPDKALEPGAPAVHEGGNRFGEPSVYQRGDTAAGFAAADVVIENNYYTPTQIHTPMEVHGSIVQWDGERLTVWDTTQGVFNRRIELAQTFQLPMSSIRVISLYMGGGFGSKLEVGKYTVIAALLARMTNRPVKIFLSREETFLSVGNRPSNRIWLKAGAKKDGTLTALEARFSGPTGAYPTWDVTSSYQIADLYTCPNVHTEEQSIFINAGKARPMRAPGFPSCSWALEQTMDELAAKLGLDPVELRLKNVPTVSQIEKNIPYTTTGLRQCLSEGAKAFGWSEARRRPGTDGHLRRGTGMAAGMWGWGGEPSAIVIVKLLADGSVNLNMGASDIGTGTKTVMAMVVSEELDVPLEKIAIDYADTGTTQYAPDSGGSQTVLVCAPAVRSAAAAVKAELLELAAAELSQPVTALRLRNGTVEQMADGKQVPIPELKSLAQRQLLIGIGRRRPHPPGKTALPFAAQFAEVEVNTRTGAVRVVRMVAAHDSGRVMDLLTYENQVIGGIAMSLGLALTEQRVIDRQTGKVLTANWHDYKIPTALDVPASQTCLPIDLHDTECNNTGAKGLGEPATIPTAAAIANAVCDALGVRVFDGPITPARVLETLSRKGA
jgi:CO/xanthine dehydrogenase Mo-binding subunit